jgi:hypothetical protein
VVLVVAVKYLQAISVALVVVVVLAVAHSKLFICRLIKR